MLKISKNAQRILDLQREKITMNNKSSNKLNTNSLIKTPNLMQTSTEFHKKSLTNFSGTLSTLSGEKPQSDISIKIVKFSFLKIRM